MIALILGTLLAVGALAYVLFPLFFAPVAAPVASQSRIAPAPLADGDRAIVALREIEFDRATGKLSESDYAVLKQKYTQEAVVAMRRKSSGAAAGVAVEDEVEAAVLAYRRTHRECADCGPRPEPDAIYCSNCGKYLLGGCVHCGAAVSEPGARFCTSCGHQLAA